MLISANDLKTKGVSIIESMLNGLQEAIITVRGKSKFVVVDINRYNYLRECELEKALNDAKNDIKNGKSRVLSAKEHIKELEDELRD